MSSGRKMAVGLRPGDLASFAIGEPYWPVEAVKAGPISGTLTVDYRTREGVRSRTLLVTERVPWIDRDEAHELNLGRGA